MTIIGSCVIIVIVSAFLWIIVDLIARQHRRRRIRRAMKKTWEECGDDFCKAVYEVEMAQSKWWDLLPWDEERKTDE